MEELIINKARALFFSYGLKSVSMDDISGQAAMSKKTVYKFFEDKNQLVDRLVGDFLQCLTEQLEKCSREAKDAVEEVVLFAQTLLELAGKISPNFFLELRKFCPVVWKTIEEHNRNVVLPLIAGNLKKGINEDLYRADIDIPFITDLRLQQVVSVLDVKGHAGRMVQSAKLMKQLTGFYLHAIATPKGKILINKYLNEYDDRQFSN